PTGVLAVLEVVLPRGLLRGHVVSGVVGVFVDGLYGGVHGLVAAGGLRQAVPVVVFVGPVRAVLVRDARDRVRVVVGVLEALLHRRAVLVPDFLERAVGAVVVVRGHPVRVVVARHLP